MKRFVSSVLLLLLLSGACRAGSSDVTTVGAIYPTGGSQAMGGSEELRGVRLAAEFVNEQGGVRGKQVRVKAVETNSAEAAPRSLEQLDRERVSVVLGSYGSPISKVAAGVASARDILFWETGAVGLLDSRAELGRNVFRFAPTGGSLGRAAVEFVQDQLRPMAGVESLKYAVTYVDDDYGRSVGLGAIDEIKTRGLSYSGAFPYKLQDADYAEIARHIKESGADVLVVAAYLNDGVALRKSVLQERVPLVASIGTSSSYCMPEFGEALGAEAVGLFASDKPSGDFVNMERLTPAARDALTWAREKYADRYDTPMDAEVLSGFAGALALFRHVMHEAESDDVEDLAAAALAARVPDGALPNGGGLQFGKPGSKDAGNNLKAANVIWEWVAPEQRAVVWPPALATAPIDYLPISAA